MKNNNLLNISISQIKNIYNIGEGLNDDFLIFPNLLEDIDILSFPCRVNALIACICTSGDISITLNLSEINITKNSYVIILPENIVRVTSVSKDFKGFAVMISFDYLKKININLKEVFPYYVFIKNYPHITTDAAKIKTISQLYELIKNSLRDPHSLRKDDIIKGLISSMVFKICEDLDTKGFNNLQIQTKTKEYYFINFMELLIQDFRKYHSVGYYSTKLGITPKYLSSLIKDISGSSAAEWIDEYIIMESKALLKFSDAKIKEIADYLYFPNQSFFSKYFKHHTQETPGSYRSRQ